MHNLLTPIPAWGRNVSWFRRCVGSHHMPIASEDTVVCAEHDIKASVFSLNYLDGRTDNCVVGPSKQTRRLGFWLWVFVVALAASIWPWQPTVRLISPAGT